MADKYEQFLMKEKLKEARHQAKLDDLRRKRELAEIKDVKAKARSRNMEWVAKLIMIGICVAMVIWVILIWRN